MHAAGSGKKGRKRNMNFELNLVPFIDVLSTCICFLLVTAVFINLGSFHVNQAVGDQKVEKAEKPKGSITVNIGDLGDVRFEVKDVRAQRGAPLDILIHNDGGKINFARTQDWIKSFATHYAGVKTVLIMPSAKSKYNDLVQLMAQFKESSLDQIGIAPL